MKLNKKIIELQMKAKAVNTPHTFAKWAKINREIAKLKDDAAALDQVVQQQHSKFFPLWMKLRAFQIISKLFIMYHLYGQSLAPIPLGMKSFWFSNITPFSWFIICHVVVRNYC